MCNKYLKTLLVIPGLILISNVQAESLIQAVFKGNTESVKSQLRSGADINQLQKMWSERASVLHFAVRLNQTEMARLLIEEGADVDVRDGDDLTPLHIAAWHGNLKMVKLLVKSGADIRASSNDGRTPLSCSRNGDQHNTESFLESKLGSTSN